MKTIAFTVSMLLSVLSATPGLCQLGGEGYHYSGGGSRVVNQGQRGYGMPGLTAISPGTISQSARGIVTVGERINPGLPAVPWGSSISTCGDQQYKTGFQNASARPIDCPNVAGTAIINTRLPGVNWGGSIGTAGDSMRSDFHPDINRNNDAWWHPKVVVRRSQSYYNPQATTQTYDSSSHATGALSY